MRGARKACVCHPVFAQTGDSLVLSTGKAYQQEGRNVKERTSAQTLYHLMQHISCAVRGLVCATLGTPYTPFFCIQQLCPIRVLINVCDCCLRITIARCEHLPPRNCARGRRLPTDLQHPPHEYQAQCYLTCLTRM